MTALTIKKDILLPNGKILELDASPTFMEKVRTHFNLPVTQDLDDSYIRKFVWEAFKTAIDKAEGSR